MTPRKATEADVNEVMDNVNRAYVVESGDTGLAFKTTPRYISREECLAALPHTWVGTADDDDKIVCTGKAEVDAETDTVTLGPLSVDPAHQVRI